MPDLVSQSDDSDSSDNEAPPRNAPASSPQRPTVPAPAQAPPPTPPSAPPPPPAPVQTPAERAAAEAERRREEERLARERAAREVREREIEAERQREAERRAVLDEAQRGVAQVEAEIDASQGVQALDERLVLLQSLSARLKAFQHPQGVLQPNNAALRQANERHARIRDETLRQQRAREREAEQRVRESDQERARSKKQEDAFNAMQVATLRVNRSRRNFRGARAPAVTRPLLREPSASVRMAHADPYRRLSAPRRHPLLPKWHPLTHCGVAPCACTAQAAADASVIDTRELIGRIQEAREI
eukprot:3943283-Prymnesium_polylepis.1